MHNVLHPPPSAHLILWLWASLALFVLYTTAHPLYFMVVLILPFAAVVGLQLPFLLAMAFVLFSFFRIHEAFPFLMPLRIPLLLSLGAIASFTLLLMQGRVKLFWTSEMTFFSLFFAHCIVGVIMAENRPVAFSYMSNTYVKIALMVFIITYLTQNPRQLRWIGRMIVMCGMMIAFVAIKNKLNGIGLVEGTRVTISRELGSVLGDPNDLALTLLFPFSFASTMVASRGVRLYDRLLGIMGICVILLGIIYTQSRGGLLGIMTVMGILAWFRVRSKMLLICMGVVAMMALFVAAGISGRSSGGAAEAGIDESANIRLHAWMAAFNMAVRNPFTGVGIDNYYVNFFFYSDFWDNKNHAVHSTWFGVMGETGFIGFVLFIMMVWQLLRTARKLHISTRIKNRHGTKEEVTLCITSEALLAGIFSFMVSGTFLTQGFTWPIYILMALTIATVRMQQRMWQERYIATQHHSLEHPRRLS